MVDPHALVNRTIQGVTASWYVGADRSDKALIHAWLNVDGLGYIKCHTHSGVKLSTEDPYPGYEMEELASTVEVRPGTPAPLAAVVGAAITNVSDLAQDGTDVGFVIHTTRGSVAIADIGDDLCVAVWPDDPRLEQAGIVVKG